MQLSKMLFAGVVMDTNQRQIALSVLEALREDLMYAHLNNGGRVLDVADLRQYIYEQMGRIGQMPSCWMGCTATTMAMGKTSARVMVTGNGFLRENLASQHNSCEPVDDAFYSCKPFRSTLMFDTISPI
jgi:hypothetical protein